MEQSVPDCILLPLVTISKSSTLNGALEKLIEDSRTVDGRANLATKNLVPTMLQLCGYVSSPSRRGLLLLSLKFLRNLCAGEAANQNAFIQQNGVEVVLNVLNSVSELEYGIMRMALQVVANVVLAGKEHQLAIWHKFFPDTFARIARIRKRETCDPLCMILYACVDGSNGLVAVLCGDHGLHIMAEIVCTASAAGFGEDWLKLLLSRICLEESYLPALFSKLHQVVFSEKSDEFNLKVNQYVSEQVFLLSLASDILNERIREVIVPHDFASFVLQLFKKAVKDFDSVSRSNSGLPTGSTEIDVLGYSLTILRDICAQECFRHDNTGTEDAIDVLIRAELVEMLLVLLRELEPPSMIRKAMKQGENHEGSASVSYKLLPYKGFRRDIVAVIGNCAYGRKHVQDEIRQKNGILLLLQQCVADENNPYLREWGIWTVRNILEANVENQKLVADLELQGSVDVPEISQLGLRVEIDQKTRQAKLVNVA